MVVEIGNKNKGGISAKVVASAPSILGMKTVPIGAGLSMSFFTVSKAGPKNVPASEILGAPYVIHGKAYVFKANGELDKTSAMVFADVVNRACGRATAVEGGMKLLYVEMYGGNGFAYFGEHMPDPDSTVGWDRGFISMRSMPPGKLEGIGVAPFAFANAQLSDMTRRMDGPSVYDMFMKNLPWLSHGNVELANGGCSFEKFASDIDKCCGVVWGCDIGMKGH